MIVSIERIRREYQHLAQHEPPEKAVQWTAERLGIPAAAVEEAIQDQERK